LIYIEIKFMFSTCVGVNFLYNSKQFLDTWLGGGSFYFTSRGGLTLQPQVREVHLQCYEYRKNCCV